MKKLFSLILGLMLFSFSTVYAWIDAYVTNIYSNKIIGNSGVINYSLDAEVSSSGRSETDFILFELKPFWGGAFNDYEFTNTNITVISGENLGGNRVRFSKINGKIQDIKVRIEGKVAVKKFTFADGVWLTLGCLNGRWDNFWENTHIKYWLDKSFFKHPNELEVKIKNMNLGKAYPGGTLSTTNTSFGGEPAEISVKLSSLQNNDQKVKLEIMKTEGSSEYVTLTGPGKPFSADVWFEKNNSKSITLDLNKQNEAYETEVIKIDGISKVPEGQTKGIYRGTIKVRVTYGK